MKKLSVVVSVMLLLLLFTACATPPPQPAPPVPVPAPSEPAPEATPEPAPDTINLAVMKGPTGIGAVQLMENVSYNVTLADTPEQVVALLTNGGADIAALPSNLAANLYAKTGGEVRLAAVITRGMLYLLEEGDTIQSWEDLRGKTIYATGRGANPEFVLNYLLAAHDLDTVVEYKSEHAELASLLAAGEVKLGLLPEPFVTSALMQNDKLRVAFDFSEEWDAIAEQGHLTMTALVVRSKFAEQYPATVKRALADVEASIEYAKENVEEAAQLCEKYGVIPKAAVAARAIPRCNLTFISGAAMKDTIAGYYEVLFNANPQAIGGAMPDENFYYIP